MSKEILLSQNPNSIDAVRKHEETANWPFREEAIFWYGVSEEMDRRFFNGLIYPDGSKVPAPIIAFDDLRNKNTLACYDLFPDEYGIIGKITFNGQWYHDVDGRKEWELGRYSQGETLLHEYVNLYQQIGRGKDPYDQKKHGRNTHNKEFVELCGRLGIHPAPVTGVHTRIADRDCPIDVLLRDRGIPRPEGADEIREGKKNWAVVITKKEKKGKSTLEKWSCGCQNVRVGTKEFHARCTHESCGNVFIKIDGKVHNIYKGK